MAKSTNRARMIIKEAMDARGLTYRDLAPMLGERYEKLSLVVRCRNGVGERAIEMRKKVAAALSLRAEDVWEPQYLTVLEDRKRIGSNHVKPFSEVTDEEWAGMAPRERARSILGEKKMTLTDLAKSLGLGERTVFNALHRPNCSVEVRQTIATGLGCTIDDIWGVPSPTDEKSLTELCNEYPEAKAFYGFGDLSKRIRTPYRCAVDAMGGKLTMQKPDLAAYFAE